MLVSIVKLILVIQKGKKLCRTAGSVRHYRSVNEVNQVSYENSAYQGGRYGRTSKCLTIGPQKLNMTVTYVQNNEDIYQLVTIKCNYQQIVVDFTYRVKKN